MTTTTSNGVSKAPVTSSPTAATTGSSLKQQSQKSVPAESEALTVTDQSQNTMGAAPSSEQIPDDGTGVVYLDPWLGPFKDEIRTRYNTAKNWIQTFDKYEGGPDKFSKGYETLGPHVLPTPHIVYREWAPNAVTAALIGDFNNWNRESHHMQKNNFGVWEITVPAVNGQPAIPHNTKIKISMVVPHQGRIERLPAWIKRVTQDLSVSPIYDAVFWNPPQKYVLKNSRPPKPR